MEYREIVSVTGIGGLFQLLTTKADGAVVRNIGDKTTKFISARQHNVTPLDSIEVYTTSENVRLHSVFEKMQEHETSIPPVDPKTADNNAIKKYFKSIFPDFDDDRVYVSDMKKMLKWFDLLKANDLLRFEQPVAETEEVKAEAPAIVAESAPAAEAEKPAKKSRAKKTAEKAETAEGEEKPAKKTAAKKKKTEE